MAYNFDKELVRTNTNSIKWDWRKKVFGDASVMPFWVADMDFESPPEVQQALMERVKHNTFGYTYTPDTYWQAIINWVSKRHRWRLKKEWLLSTPGVIPALNFAVQSFTQPGDQVIIQPPVYHPFYNIVKGNDRKLVTNPLRLENGHYTINFEDLEEKLKAGAKMLILCNPHNPVGRVFTKQELETIGDLCLEHGAMILSDEIHGDIIYSEDRHRPIANINKELADITITATSPGKTFNLQGMVQAFVIIPNEELRKAFDATLKRNGLFMDNVLALTAVEAAYRFGEPWLHALLDYLEQNKRTLQRFIREEVPLLDILPPEATYISWIDARKLPVDDKWQFLIEKAGVGLIDGKKFGAEGDGFLRLNFACPRSKVVEGLEKVKEAINKL